MNELPERLPSRPLRNWFLAWHIHTGDPAEVIAKGFDLDLALVADLLTGQAPLMLPAADAAGACERIRMDPLALWPDIGMTAHWTFEPCIEVAGSFVGMR